MTAHHDSTEKQVRQRTFHSLMKKCRFVKHNVDSVPLKILLSLHNVCQTSNRGRAGWKLTKTTSHYRIAILQELVLAFTGINARTKTIHCLQQPSGSKYKTMIRR